MSYNPDKIDVWSNGGGTQSAAIAALIVEGRLPKPDIAVIADTGREMPTTWDYLDNVVAPALAGVGVEMHRIKASEMAAPRGKNLFATSGHLMIPAYTNQSGQASKMSGFCSGAWKVEVIARWLSAQGIKPSNVRRWIGYSLDEHRRWQRMEAGKEYQQGKIRFPLVYDVPMRRHASVALVKSLGWPEPPRSRCWMCPHQSDYEWREVQRDYPELWEAACRMDDEIRRRDPHAFLHSSIGPLADADISREDDLFSGSCATGVCFL